MVSSNAFAGANPNAQHPSIVMMDLQARAESLASEVVRSGLWPKIQLQARVSYDYPNQSALEYVTQKYVSLNASVPLFEMRKTSREARQHESLASAARNRRDLAREQLLRDWDKAQAILSALNEQQALDSQSVSEAEELSRLVYSAYKAGRSNFLDVQTYNLNALQAKVAAARTRAQILIQLAMLAQLFVQG
jgi:outer membrane protein TolC